MHGVGTVSMTRNQTIIAYAVAALVLAAIAVALPNIAASVRGLFAPKSYDWISRTMSACEEEAVSKPDTLNFLIMPLERTRRFGKELDARALETVGRATLFGSQDALDGLKSGALRISSKSYVLTTLDTANNTERRWNSASGVSKLSTTDVPSDGPFRVRLQVSAKDNSTGWSNVTAEGRGTCHWVFALLRE
jgi:hypothetical protein